MKPQELPVYQQKQRILNMLSLNQVIVVESPTGSGKTTQLPVILHEAGYTSSGIIGITQPRRIAALSVSEFISRQLGTVMPGLVGYKMRFEDKTDQSTRIKIMTDGMLLQEMKLDPWLSKYSVIMVDEAHERSLNIDFILGLLKRILEARHDFKVIVSSATINTELFAAYFDDCPTVKIDAITYPVTLIYDPPVISASSETLAAEEALMEKIAAITGRILEENRQGDILVFLPGERAIKNCIEYLSGKIWYRRLYVLPLYGRLSKEEQERVFLKAPPGKKKIIIATNIAETSVTIDGITSVIDSGLAKLNYYNPRTFTSGLIESSVSKASCNQRRGRAGRTGEGTCYRLYERKDFETRPLYTTEEIYRTDLSEVVLRMAELGITDFEQFDFISPPGKEGLLGAIDTLNLLGALADDNSLSKIGEMMCLFPLSPRQSRIIVEAMLNYPQVTEEVLIAAAFLSAQSPFILPQGKEMDARRAHHSFRDANGDFVSFLRIFRMYTMAQNKKKFCEINYLDERVLAEIANIKIQLELIISDKGIPVLSGGPIEDYLTAIAVGLIQFLCANDGRDTFHTLTAERIQIHPGSCMYRENPQYIVAGEIVKTSRMYAMSVSPLSRHILERIDPDLPYKLKGKKDQKHTAHENSRTQSRKTEKRGKIRDNEYEISFGGEVFEIIRIKSKKQVQLPFKQFKKALASVDTDSSYMTQIAGLRGKIIINGFGLLTGEKMSLIIKIAENFDLEPVEKNSWPRKKNFILEKDPSALITELKWLFRITVSKEKSKELGFICLFTDKNGQYWFKSSRGFYTALNESITSLEYLIDETADIDDSLKTIISEVYRKANQFFVEDE
ncbi:ATP-dependent RNA helicase [Brucepastera parasyntrophica]|uniref:helicase-related protein n=1 Tax=Brucepastera parasyntrophica TaxID=2880008 RepID=UPI002108DCC7|nr:ATP-dependent RNA helicase [Brucepastera parasyntrophica]ULQ59997.1 ATP-dependent RNA helicase [Brucepastera parasyntrophica]